jgi:ASC-1-like (ASCH) protein
MDHVAILRKARVSKGDNLLQDILDGTKTIESRWYVNKISPWNNIKAGDTVYLKESGCPVYAKAKVFKVEQFENLEHSIVEMIIKKYGREIAPHASVTELNQWVKEEQKKRYCILIFLEKVVKVEPFYVNKAGFGISSAWMAVGDINRVKILSESKI